MASGTKRTPKEIAASQLHEDYKAAVSQFCIDPRSVDPYKMYCIGVAMCILTLKGYAENAKLRPTEDLEESVELYYTAAQKKINAN